MVCANFPPEPVVAASITYDLAQVLAERHRVRVLTPRPSRPLGFTFKSENTETQKFEQIVLQSFTCPKSSLLGRIRESYSFGKHVSQYIRNHKSEIDFVYICAWPLLAQYMIVREVNHCSLPSVVHIEDIYPESLTNKIAIFNRLIYNLLLPIDIYILKNSSRVIAVSENMRNNFIHIRKLSPEKITIIPNWQDESEFVKYEADKTSKRQIEAPHKPFTFMYLGNIGPVAGVEFIIKSFIAAELHNTRLVIAGSGSKRKECQELASTHQYANIEFWDVPAGKVPEIQMQADVMLLPVKHGAAMSSIPSKLIAYLFSKKPVIACVDEKSDTELTIKNASCGWILPPEELTALVKTLQTVVSIPHKELETLGRNGFNYAIENFSKKRNLEKLVHLIHDVSGTTQYKVSQRTLP
jgi:glycosyltransferase involved in cell wall biosynthesis